MIAREEILENLIEGICRITFRKVTDGKYRILYGTLFQEDVPHIEKDKLMLMEILSAQKNHIDDRYVPENPPRTPPVRDQYAKAL